MARRVGWLGGPLVLGFASVGGAITLDSYEKYILGLWCVYSLAALGLLFPAGWVGEVSVGQAGVLAIAAYGASLLRTNLIAVELITGCVLGAIAGCVLGLPSLRLRGFGLAIATLVFGEFVRLAIIATPALDGASGRFIGVPQVADPSVRQAVVTGLAGVLLSLGVLLAALIRRSTLGRQWRAVRDNERLARAFGCNPGTLRLAAFVLGGAYCGVAGVLFGWLTQYVSPESFNLWLSVYLLAMVVIGGRDELWGPLFGAGLVVMGGEALRISGDLQSILFGVVMLLVAWFLPRGVVRAAAESMRGRRRARARMAAAAPLAESGAQNLDSE
jgi:ABC-type branched-subunit amino acid transport system permease subunit